MLIFFPKDPASVHNRADFCLVILQIKLRSKHIDCKYAAHIPKD